MPALSQTKALVSRGPVSHGKWSIEPVKLRELEDDEVLVEIVASGICHTDLHCGNTAGDKNVPGVFYPRVLGHEGEFLSPSRGFHTVICKKCFLLIPFDRFWLCQESRLCRYFREGRGCRTFVVFVLWRLSCLQDW